MARSCARQQLAWSCGAVVALSSTLAACSETTRASSDAGTSSSPIADAGQDAARPDAGSKAGSGTDTRVVIGPELTACEEHLDCQLVETACSGCCVNGAIAKQRAEAFQTDFEAACRDYRGGICRCLPPDVVPRCYDHECMAVARADVLDCFSPAQNAWAAFADDGVGCSCELEEPRACASEGALECTSVPSGAAAWHGIEDASCIARKLADPAPADDPEAVPLHLFVIPPPGPPAPIDVWIDDVHVVTGYFDYGPWNLDPGLTYLFDLSVVGPTLTLRAEAPQAMLEQAIEAPAERWVVLHYSLDKVSNPGEINPKLILTVSDRPFGSD